MKQLVVQRIDLTTRQAFLSLSQNYEAEFSKITRKLPNGNGQYEITDEQPGKYDAWICKEDDQIIGFAVIDISRRRFDVAEFYIIPTHRRSASGSAMANYLFDQYAGPWQVRQIMGAEQAKAFWIETIKKYSHNQFTDGKEKDPDWGEVYIQTFLSRSKGDK